MAAHVVVRNLRKSYDGVEAVRDVSFAIEPGEIFGLLGPNGAGKTTTVECVVGLREPDSGELEVCGLDARRRPRDVKQKIGVALQSTSLQDKITPREALRLFGSFYREKHSPETLLQRFALEEKADARFDTLSGGQRQRLALALAFVNRPQLVLLDEPTTGLDPQSRRELHGSIRRMKDEGHTVLFTTHYLNEAEELCDRVAIIDRGRIVASGKPAELIAQSKGAQSVTLMTSSVVPRDRLTALPDVSEVTCDGNTARFKTANAAATLASITAWLHETRNELIELQVRKGSLEDVFLGLTANDKGDAATLPLSGAEQRGGGAASSG